MPLIAMTREMGSLGRDVAAGIAAPRGKRVIYQEIIEPIANKMRLRKSHVERFLEGRAGIWERLTTDRTSLAIFTAEETLRFLREPSTAVIRGWGAVHLLKDIPHVVRVRVCAPMALRVDRMMARLGTENRAAVENEIAMSEEAHTAITRRHFAVDWRDPENYDLVLCTERLDVGECIEELEAVMAKPRFRETPESLRLADDLAIAWSVRAALRRDARTAAAKVTVACDAGVVRLEGGAIDAAAARAAAEVAAGIEGVRSIENDMSCRAAAGSA